DAAFLEALKGDYMAATRTKPGIWSAPNGEAIYRSLMLRWTTLVLDPTEVHESGLAELEQIEVERRAISNAAGFGDDVVAYRASLGAEPSNVPTSREELVARISDMIERAAEQAPSMF